MKTSLKNEISGNCLYYNKQEEINAFDNTNGGIFGLNKDTNDVLVKDCVIVNKLGGAEIPVEINFAAIILKMKKNMSVLFVM